MTRRSHFAIWFPVLVPFFACLFLLIAGITAAIVRTPPAFLGFLGVTLFSLLATLAALNWRATVGLGLFLLPAIFLLSVKLLEPAWMSSPRLFGSVAVGLLCLSGLITLLTIEKMDRLLNGLALFATAGVLLLAAKMIARTEMLEPADIAAMGVGAGFAGFGTFAWKGSTAEPQASVQKWTSVAFYPCILVFAILAIMSSHDLVGVSPSIVGIEFVTGLNELAGERGKKRRAVAAGVAMVAILAAIAPGFRYGVRLAASWIVRPANWPLMAATVIWSVFCLRVRPGWRQFLVGGLTVLLVVWLIRDFYVWLGIAHPNQSWSDLLKHNK